MLLLKKIIKLIKFKLWRKGLLNGIAATVELENMLKGINLETIIDVGSNKGQFIILIEKLFPNSTIYSFEPITEILEKQKKFFHYKKNIFYYNFALGSESSTKEFFVTKRKDSSSFFRINLIGNKNKNYQIKKTHNIEIKTLDDIILDREVIEPILIKIDVQGYELEVLKGSDKILKKVDFILLEVSKNEMYQNQPKEKEIIEYLQYRNFYILKQNNWSIIKKTDFSQRDILFKNKKINE